MNRMTFFARRVSQVACLMLGSALLIPAQVSTGSIAGLVADESHAVVPSVAVTLINRDTGVQKTTTTDAAGFFAFPVVPPGYYTLRASVQGFQTYETTGLEVQVAQQVKHDIQLKVGDTTTKVEVMATTPVLEQRSAEIGQVIGQKELAELPLNGRNFLDLTKIVPGVAELPGSTQSNGIAINGQRANQIGFYFDGVDMRTEAAGTPAFSPSVEAIQEFKIQLNDFSAEYGRSPAAINLSLR